MSTLEKPKGWPQLHLLDLESTYELRGLGVAFSERVLPSIWPVDRRNGIAVLQPEERKPRHQTLNVHLIYLPQCGLFLSRAAMNTSWNSDGRNLSIVADARTGIKSVLTLRDIIERVDLAFALQRLV